MKDELRNELRQYAWAYFDRHAEQRLKTFNFYLILCAAIIAGLFAFAREPEELPNAWPLPLLLSVLSFIFWKLDLRTRDLTKHSEEALKLLEDELPLADEAAAVPHRCKLFRREEYESAGLVRFPKVGLISAHFSYSTCFQWIFGLFGYGGVALCLILLVLWIV